jgi:hypothetical protein
MMENLFIFHNVVCHRDNVGRVLDALSGNLLLTRPEPQKIINARVVGGQLVPISRGEQNLHGLFEAWLEKERLTEVVSKDVRRFLTEQGKSSNSYSYILTHAKSSGLLRKVSSGKGSSGVRWVVVSKQKLLPAPKGNGAKKKVAAQ